MKRNDTTIAIRRDIHKAIQEYSLKNNISIRQIIQFLVEEFLKGNQKIVLTKKPLNE